MKEKLAKSELERMYAEQKRIFRNDDGTIEYIYVLHKNDKTSVVDIHKVNGKRPAFDIYAGREVRDRKTGDIIFKESKWANPHLPLEGNGLTYEVYIIKKIAENPIYYDLNELKDKEIACWCITTDKLEPLKCHVQIIMKLIRERNKRDNMIKGG